jgi:phosphinothricin acetyltransferase
MKIRIAEIQDLEAMVGIYNQAIFAGQRTAHLTPFSIDDRKPWFKEHRADAYPILVAECGHAIAGYLTISAYRPGRMALRHTAEISCYVRSDHHRQGIGAGLLRKAIGIGPSFQIRTFIAILMDTNLASIRLLEKHGFHQWGHMPKVADYNGIEVGHLYYGLRIAER